MSKKFNHLNIPSHWQSYWTRFPEGHTILEALIQWVSQVDEMVDSYNELTDHVDNFKEAVNNTTDGFREELDTFLRQFDDNLALNVITTLSEWENSGFLDVVINDALDTKYHEMDDRLTAQADQLTAKVAQTTPTTTFTFILDDHYVGDRRAFPLFEERGWVFNSAFIVDKMLNDFSPTRNSNIDYYRKLQELGGSMLGHTMTHFDLREPGIEQGIAEWQIAESRRSIESIGFKCRGWVSAYSQTHNDYFKYIKFNYDYAFNKYMGNITEHINSGNTVYHNPSDDIYNLTRVSTATTVNSLAELKLAVDEAIENKGFICFYDHSIGGDTGTEISAADLTELLDYIKNYEEQGLCQVLPTDQAVYNYFSASPNQQELDFGDKTELPITNFEMLESTAQLFNELGKWGIGGQSDIDYTLNKVNDVTQLDITSMSSGQNLVFSVAQDISGLNKDDYKKAVLDFYTDIKMLSSHTREDMQLKIEYAYFSDFNSSSTLGTYIYFNSIDSLLKERRYHVKISPTRQDDKDLGVALRVVLRFTAKKDVNGMSLQINNPRLYTAN